ncbi:uncharacterized protein SCHCODRAFT_02521547 [Schizophyllum commune H4-8]|nr:uncharacterized protein SCHCODRAFT_02521547 [Schizophyllum commune H4-8]KAI5884842.1 hypothetical protein SCHCODRAFT_02521547 [Schizophyllum commune H4-8]
MSSSIQRHRRQSVFSLAPIAAFVDSDSSPSEKANLSNLAPSCSRREARARTSPGRWGALMDRRRTPRLVLLAPPDTPEHALHQCPTVDISTRAQDLFSHPAHRPRLPAPLSVAKDTPTRSTSSRYQSFVSTPKTGLPELSFIEAKDAALPDRKSRNGEHVELHPPYSAQTCSPHTSAATILDPPYFPHRRTA